MKRNARNLTHAALIAALYTALCWAQELLLAGSASLPLQLRVAEALCVLAFFTPTAIPGLAVGCLLFNISASGVLPLDFLVGAAASALAAGGMYLSRRVTVRGFPLLGLCMPALWNGLLVGWELSLHMGGGFWLNALYVAAGEAIVLFVLGTGLYYTLRRHRAKLFFGA